MEHTIFLLLLTEYKHFQAVQLIFYLLLDDWCLCFFCSSVEIPVVGSVINLNVPASSLDYVQHVSCTTRAGNNWYLSLALYQDSLSLCTIMYAWPLNSAQKCGCHMWRIGRENLTVHWKTTEHMQSQEHPHKTIQHILCKLLCTKP